MYSRIVCLSGEKQDGLIIRCLWGWFDYQVYMRMVWLSGVYEDGLIVRCIWGWFDYQVYMRMVWLSGVYEDGLIVRCIWGWFDYQVHTRMVWLSGVEQDILLIRCIEEIGMIISLKSTFVKKFFHKFFQSVKQFYDPDPSGGLVGPCYKVQTVCKWHLQAKS